jgi:hypothetical protein
VDFKWKVKLAMVGVPGGLEMLRVVVSEASKVRSGLRVKSDVNGGKDTRWSSNVKGVIVKTN